MGQGAEAQARKKEEEEMRIKFLARHKSDPGAEGVEEHNNKLRRRRRRYKGENCDGEGVFL